MTINEELLKILVCPETKDPVRLLTPDETESLNDAIRSGAVKTVAGAVVQEEFEAGLIRSDNRRVYRIKEGIPVMLIEEGVDFSLK